MNSPRTLEVHGKQSVYPVVKRNVSGNIMHVFAVCTTLEKAEACATNANAWYGDEHPLTPLVALNDDTCFLDPKPFPETSI